MSTMQETVTGVRCEGDWETVVNSGEDVTEALREAGADEDDLERWEEWRPRDDESLDDELREKTVEQATVDENDVEAAGQRARDEAQDVVGSMSDAVGRAVEGRHDDAAASSGRALSAFARGVDTVVRKAVRKVEETVYRHVVARTNPCYFDDDLVSARLERKRQFLRDESAYELSIDINDDRVKEEIGRRVAG